MVVSLLLDKLNKVVEEIIEGSFLHWALWKRPALYLSILGILFAAYVWPTRYKDLPSGGPQNLLKYRQDRFTGGVQFWFQGEWK